MNGMSIDSQGWRSRVVELLDDPVGQAILRRDGLNRDEVIEAMARAACRLRQRGRGPAEVNAAA